MMDLTIMKYGYYQELFTIENKNQIWSYKQKKIIKFKNI